ncbi:hypothetical protein D3C80_1799120 [compost metagenome]
MAVPVELFVRAELGGVAKIAQLQVQCRVIANLAFGKIIGDVHDRLALYLVDDHFGVGEEQQRDAVGDCLVVLDVHLEPGVGT